MPQNPNPEIIAANNHIRAGVIEQIKDLEPSLIEQFGVDTIMVELENLNALVGGKADVVSDLLTKVIKQVKDIQDGTKLKSDFASVIGNLDTLRLQIDDTNNKVAINSLASIYTRVNQLLNYRPDVTAILGDLEAIKNLKGGPADATAFHDFHVLQMAFKNIWMQAVDENLRSKAEQLYEETVKLYDDAGLKTPDFAAVDDVNKMQDFLKSVQGATGIVVGPPTGRRAPTIPMPHFLGAPYQQAPSPVTVSTPPEVSMAYPEAGLFWNHLTSTQQSTIVQLTKIINDSNASREQKEEAKKNIADILKVPEGSAGRLTRLMLELGNALSEPYAFDIFAPNSYNYGIMLTYRQKWEPGPYQAGDLAATIPLAPGETRKYSKKRVVKKSRSAKEIEKSMSSHSTQSSEIARAESEIMKKASTATNFKMTTDGSFNIGIGSIHSSTEFAMNQAQESANNKKEFHESTLKAAEEYRLERSMEIDTSTSSENEESSSGEISNPNNEITVTYLFYELQRRYKISEFIYRARPVILIAQDVPSPHEIDEAWLIQYQWIISRVLLDDSFRSALEYLTSGMAGDEVSIAVIKAHWQNVKSLTDSLESQVKTQLKARDDLRTGLIQSALDKDLLPDMPDALKIFTFGVDPSDGAKDWYEAHRKATESRLKFVEEGLADSQNKLKQATDSYEKATQQYAGALQQQYSRHISIDQLRVHIKQNILYYMQAIWSHEPPDQRFFRLYNKKVTCTKPTAGCPIEPKIAKPTIASYRDTGKARLFGTTRAVKMEAAKISVNFKLCLPIMGKEIDLVEMADIDNPLGYKGNYIIFPLKQNCYLTDYMLHEFVDEYFGVRDPDQYGNYTIEELGNLVNEAINNESTSNDDKTFLKEEFLKYLTMARRTSDEIIVPTGQLFIEALPGSHPLLEDFKLLHRVEDVRKVKAEVRHAELENLRLASRLIAGETDSKLLDDPDIEKKIIVEGNSSVAVNTGP